MRTGILGILALAAVVAAACGSVPPTASTTSAPSSRDLALVTVRGSNDIVVVDITDIRNPKTVSTLGQISLPMFVSATELSYLQDGGLVRAPLSGSPKTIMSSQAVDIFAWSPDGNAAAYLTSDFNGTESKMELHLMSAGKDRVVGSMSGLPKVWGCETQACADTYDLHLSYSPDGRFISWAQNVRPVFRLWAADGKDVTPSTVVPFMTVWSDAGLYFGDSKGIEVYRAGVVSPFLPGATWIRPKGSAGGGQILYEARDGSGLVGQWQRSGIHVRADCDLGARSDPSAFRPFPSLSIHPR